MTVVKVVVVGMCSSHVLSSASSVLPVIVEIKLRLDF